MMVLLTGGTGLLGKELIQYFDSIDVPSHEVFDITRSFNKGSYDLVIHCAAYTDVVKAETDQQECFDVNVMGTMNLTSNYWNTPLVYISSEYVNHPQNYYSLTKRFAEDFVKFNHKKHLIIRTLFKPSPFPYNKAFIDQFTQGDYVDVIAKLIAQEIKKWDQRTSKVIYVGTGRKTIHELARQTRPDVGIMSVKDIKQVKLPKDYL